jgi:hypothetical protein
MSADNTDRKQSGLIPFKPGQSGNPTGRPKGARNKLGDAFIEALYADWQAHGKLAIEKVRQQRPQEYLKLIASLQRKHVELRVDPFAEVSDEELSVLINWAQSAIAEAAGDAEDEADEITEEGAPGSRPHTPLVN